MKKLLPLIMLLLGTGAGVGAGIFLRPEPTPADEYAAMEEQEKEAEDQTKDSDEKLPIDGREYVKLSNQFVIPLVERDRINSMVVMTLSVEVPDGQGEAVYDMEPKIRDVFLRVLFDHAAIGGFSGAFINNENFDGVRHNLVSAARKTFGEDYISDVLIFEIARQDY